MSHAPRRDDLFQWIDAQLIILSHQAYVLMDNPGRSQQVNRLSARKLSGSRPATDAQTRFRELREGSRTEIVPILLLHRTYPRCAGKST